MKRKEMKRMEEKKVIPRIRKGVLGVVLSGLLMAGSGAVLAKDSNSTSKIPDVININTQKACPDLEGIGKDKKSVEGFTHKAHIQFLQKEEKNAFVCATCHKGAKTEEEIIKSDKCKRLSDEFKEVGGASHFMKYFHDSCKNCHKSRKKEGKATGPVSCKGCHARKGGEK